MGLKALLIYNPTAGPWDMSRVLKRLAHQLERNRWSLSLAQTAQPGDATRIARQAAEQGMDVVLVAGGDGTINEAVNGLVGSEVILGIVPVGTGNILAHQLRMPTLSLTAPLQLPDVVSALESSRVQRVDVGIINERHFICWAGVGLDAEVTAQMEPRPRYAKRLGTLPYIIAGFIVASDFRGVRTRINVEGHSFNARALMVLVSNIQLYGSFFNIARYARMDDGLLDVFVFKGLGFSYALRHLMHLFSGRHLSDPKVVQVWGRNIQVRTSPAVAVHLDGDPFGETPVTIQLRARALRLLVPPQAPADLFSHPPDRHNLH